MVYDTRIISDSDEDLQYAAQLIKDGKIVGMPTETVYGLAANALDPSAVADIFKAKGRPQDNPLIVHLASVNDIEKYAQNIPETAYRLAEMFCPGPLTMVLPKRECIPDITSAGLDTVGIRIPADQIARRFIAACGTPIAAPSANLSGSPSPTTAKHVFQDMNGRIPAIIDGGSCCVGVESTVVSFEGDKIVLLRPGFISPEELSAAGEVIIGKGITEAISDGEIVRSPGMKYKHYSPKANVTIIEGNSDKYAEYVISKNKSGTAAMCFASETAELERCGVKCVPYGNTSEEQAQLLFLRLRECDELGFEQVYAHCPPKNGVGLAVYNRLLRAAGFEVIKL